MPLLGFLLPRPFAGRGFDGIEDVVGDIARASQSSGCSALSVRMIEVLPRSAYWMYADARCSAQITGVAGIGPHLGQRALQPFAGGSEGAERIADPDAPVGAGDELARNAAPCVKPD